MLFTASIISERDRSSRTVFVRLMLCSPDTLIIGDATKKLSPGPFWKKKRYGCVPSVINSQAYSCRRFPRWDGDVQ